MGYLHEALVYLITAVIAVPVAKRLGFGSVLGYLLGGLAIGPWVLGLISEVDHILHFSELGVVFLLFVIGLELQPSRLWVLRRMVFGLGAAQVLVTGAVIGGLAWAAGMPAEAAVVAGGGLALSSTAFVLQLLAEKQQLTSRFGRSAFSILLFQDLAVIPILAAVPLLATTAPNGGTGAGRWLLGIAALLALVFGGRYLLRPVLRWVAGTGIEELFTAVALLVVIGSATLMEVADLSMGLGAFVAGMLLADSEYRHQLEADIEPFKGLLLGLFFIAVGMSVNLGLIASRPGDVFGLVAALLLVKATVIYALARLFGLGNNESRSLSLVLPQGGEFAFVIFTAAVAAGVLDRATSELLIVAVILSMAVTPLLYIANEAWGRRTAPAVPEPEYDRMPAQHNDILIAGFGRVGQIVGRILRSRGIPFTALENSPERLDAVRRFGNVVHFGDASRPDLLKAAGIEHARFFVLAFGDVDKSVKLARWVRQHYPKVTILARARNRLHAYALMDLGVQVIIRETLHSSLLMSEHLLRDYGIGDQEAARIVKMFAEHDEATLRRQQAVAHDMDELVQTTREAARELESLIRADRRKD
ncbi:monovalent cation:proton antiporter-2 (CPA2) family protein [Lentisalinibacter salinarum]|uniref:monovalent cation:proton antiporter-2 (CPA2) family protein n=1 Tax=Lentisalinibacter salinarum TaxID=2992239 RepID=UPI003865A8A4